MEYKLYTTYSVSQRGPACSAAVHHLPVHCVHTRLCIGEPQNCLVFSGDKQCMPARLQFTMPLWLKLLTLNYDVSDLNITVSHS
jgi:hypothetical protein